MQPSIVDGRSLVVLAQNRAAFSFAEEGILEHDGEALYLVDGPGGIALHYTTRVRPNPTSKRPQARLRQSG